MPLICLNCAAEHDDGLSLAVPCPSCFMLGMLRRCSNSPAATDTRVETLAVPKGDQCHNCGESLNAAQLLDECPACRIQLLRRRSVSRPVPVVFAAPEPQGSAASDSAPLSMRHGR